MGIDQQTVDTYDDSAAEFSDHFKTYKDSEPVKEVDLAFNLIGNPKNTRVVEIGCGAGKDAADIVKRASWYHGFDPSEKLLAIARQHLPSASFSQSNAVMFQYPENIDIVFAFASMLHLNKDDFAKTCDKITQALRPGGVLCMTLKEADEYTEQLQQDNFGTRLFYLYNSDLVKNIAGPELVTVYEDHYTAGSKQKRWFSVILRKQP